MEAVSVLGTWQGVITAAIVSIAGIALVSLLLKNFEKLRDLRVSKDGVHFNAVDLGGAIPRIDANVKLKLQSIVKDIANRALASLDLADFKLLCKRNTEDCESLYMNQRILKMLLISKMLESLYDSISRNHQVKVLAGKSSDKWIKAISSEVAEGVTVIEDYCNIDLPNEALMNSIEKILKDFYLPRARSILIDGVLAKQEVYQKLPDSDKRKEKLLAKCDDYIAGLTD